MLPESLKPAVPKNWLIAIAGVVWSAVGVMLCTLAWGWLILLGEIEKVSAATAGLLLALGTYRYLFTPIALKNIARIGQYAAKGCIFAFQAWRSYLIILAMIALGSVVRHSPLPRSYLIVVYLAMGGGLLIASRHYYRYLWQACRLKERLGREKRTRGRKRPRV